MNTFFWNGIKFETLTTETYIGSHQVSGVADRDVNYFQFHLSHETFKKMGDSGLASIILTSGCRCTFQ